MLYFTANKLTIKPCLKHLAKELHIFVCWQKFYTNSVLKTKILNSDNSRNCRNSDLKKTESKQFNI